MPAVPSTKQRTALGTVAAGHAESARAGAQVLAEGGNAADAVAAMIMAGCVVEGTLTSLAGGGFILAKQPDKDPIVFDAYVRQPGLALQRRVAPWEAYELDLGTAVLPFGSGPASVGVPMLPLGIATLLKKLGSRTMLQCAQPALELAQNGVELTELQAGEHEALWGLISRDADGAAIHGPHGTHLATGDRFAQTQLAATIEELAATGGRSLYAGGLARRLLEWSDERGGRITLADLRAATVRIGTPLSATLDSATVYTNPPPTLGGRMLVTILARMLTSYDASPEHSLNAVARAIRGVVLAEAPPATIAPTPGELVRDHRDHLPAQIALALRITPPFAPSPNTTHVSAIDRDGMVVAATTTLGLGSGEYVPGTGLHLNNVLAEYGHDVVRRPGGALPSMMSPTIAMHGDRTIALGSAGSHRIPLAVSQVLWRALVQATPLEEAIAAPRYVFDGTTGHHEPGFDGDGGDGARLDWPSIDAYFGTCNGVASNGTSFEAAGDPRRMCAGIIVND